MEFIVLKFVLEPIKSLIILFSFQCGKSFKKRYTFKVHLLTHIQSLGDSKSVLKKTFTLMYNNDLCTVSHFCCLILRYSGSSVSFVTTLVTTRSYCSTINCPTPTTGPSSVTTANTPPLKRSSWSHILPSNTQVSKVELFYSVLSCCCYILPEKWSTG